MSDNIDQFRQEIRRKLRETKNDISDSIVANHSKFNEELEFHLQNVQEDISERVYDLIIQSSNYAYVKGIQAGLTSGNEKVQQLTNIVEVLQKGKKSPSVESPNSDLQEINKTLHGLAGVILLHSTLRSHSHETLIARFFTTHISTRTIFSKSRF